MAALACRICFGRSASLFSLKIILYTNNTNVRKNRTFFLDRDKNSLIYFDVETHNLFLFCILLFTSK